MCNFTSRTEMINPNSCNVYTYSHWYRSPCVDHSVRNHIREGAEMKNEKLLDQEQLKNTICFNKYFILFPQTLSIYLYDIKCNFERKKSPLHPWGGSCYPCSPSSQLLLIKELPLRLFVPSSCKDNSVPIHSWFHTSYQQLVHKC